jgi:flavin-dependent dehydrogenase
VNAASADVAILGGGLAGLSLALQLRRVTPAARICVIERRSGPAPDAVHKIGESTVEIGAHYFGSTLGLEDHLRERHLKKFGFRFFSSDGRDGIDDVQEIGVSRYLNVTSYQIDRGIFENFIVERARSEGVDVALGTSVDAVRLATSGHEVDVRDAAGSRTLRARWVVDASGRAALLKRQLGLAEQSDHDVNSAWFRVPARIDPEAWSTDERWLERCLPGHRWRSTNHLVGDGYWVWLIPLSSGFHSVGIVADAGRHPLGQINSYSRALSWLDRHQPRLARALRELGDAPSDFVFLKHFSHGCRQLYSPDRWAITGEAGVFLDPFYSPGSDFIAICNTYVSDLIRRDLAGERFEPYASLFEQLFRSFADSTMTLYRGQYGIFRHPSALSAKVIWDYAYYWGVLCQLFFQDKLTDLRALGRVREDLLAVRSLNEAMQPFLRRWAGETQSDNPGRLLDQAALPWFDELNRSLVDRLDEDQFVRRISGSRRQIESLAVEIVARASAAEPRIRDWTEATTLLGRAGPGATSDGSLLDYPLAG